MKKKHTFSPGFWQVFLILPMLCAIVLFVLSDTILEPHNPMFTSGTLRADVYPNPDEIPDGRLPTGNLESEFLPAIIDILLALTSTVVLGVLLTSATLYIINFGDEEKLKTAKSLWRWAVAGVAFIIIAYVLVEAVTALNFARNPTP